MNKLLKFAGRPMYALQRVVDILRDPNEIAWNDLKRESGNWQDQAGMSSIPRIAIVKQDVYPDLYCCSHGASTSETISSSLMRTGPVGLFTRLNADFWIVHTESDPECGIWKQRCTDCRQGTQESYEILKSRPFKDGARGHLHAQGEYAVASDSVDWSVYDIVISFDVSVPARITRKYPETVWAYCVGEPCMGAYLRSHDAPIEGYDLFLNQHFRCIDTRTVLSPHEIEFPYYLQYHGCFEDVYGPSSDKPRAIMLEYHTESELNDSQRNSLAQYGPLQTTKSTTAETVRALRESKYFVRFRGRKLWGNAMIEAIACGCLVIGNPNEYKHRALFTPETTIDSFDELTACIKRFEESPESYENAVREQRERIDYLCFARPIRDLIAAQQRVLSARMQRRTR